MRTPEKDKNDENGPYKWTKVSVLGPFHYKFSEKKILIMQKNYFKNMGKNFLSTPEKLFTGGKIEILHLIF